MFSDTTNRAAAAGGEADAEMADGAE